MLLKINPNSKYASQPENTLGVVVKYSRLTGTDLFYTVRWGNDRLNCYGEEDLILEDFY